MRSSGPEWVRSLTLRGTAPVVAVVLMSAVLFAARPFGFADAVNNSPLSDPLLCMPFLIAYALGFEVGTTAGLTGVALLIAALQVVNGAFSPVEIMITAGPWVAGRIVRSKRRLAGQLRARNDELRAQQEAYAAEAVRYERSRIAADLHDLVGHALSLMVIQASAGQRAALTRDTNASSGKASSGMASSGEASSGEASSVAASSGQATARMALETVAEAARKAQAEVGLLTGLLSAEQAREGLAPDDQAGAPYAIPSPGGLGLAAELVRHAQSAGLEVTYRLISDGHDRDADADAASAEVVSRIVTEALTNALKHAPGAPVTVEVRTGGGGVTVTVENGASRQSGSDLARTGGGYGLKGMRDRVLAHGGRLDAGPTADDGWRVHAFLPAGD
ncbi:MAG TPA: ATP-binding protein [Streptosporangiaceae bacterium]|jgi:signal transduction histidine kinase